MPRVAENVLARPAGPLRPLVTLYIGYRYEGFPAGRHLGLPSRHLTVVLSLGPQTRFSRMPDPAQTCGAYTAMASGLSMAPAEIVHDGVQYGVQLELTPAGARALLGLPAGALGPTIVDLADLIGGAATELVERLATLTTWPARFAALDEALLRRAAQVDAARRSRSVDPALARAWRSNVASGGRVRVRDVADEVGWSRRHLADRFAAEYGVPPKDAARLVRFERSRWLAPRTRSPGGPTLADVAAACGYYDQAHLAREWRDLAGCSPTAWLAGEEFPIVQAGDGPPVRG